MCSRMIRTVRHIIRTATYSMLCGIQHNIENVRVLAIDRAFFLLWGGLMEASAKGLTLWGNL